MARDISERADDGVIEQAKQAGFRPRSLDAVNFMLADVRGALGPYLNVFLITQRHWSQTEVGWVTTISGLLGLVAQTPAGAAIDATRRKREAVVLALIVLAIGAAVIFAFPYFWPVLMANTGIAVVGDVFGPAVAAITLGLYTRARLARQMGRNSAFDHAGNVAIAAAAGAVGYVFSQRAVFLMVPVFAALASIAMLSIPARAIDEDRARGLDVGDARQMESTSFLKKRSKRLSEVRAEPIRKHGLKPQKFFGSFFQKRTGLLLGSQNEELPASHDADPPEGRQAPSGYLALLRSPPLIVFALCAMLFHFANAPLLPLVGQKLAQSHPAWATAMMSSCIIAAQLIMLPVALAVGHTADRLGRKPILLLGFAVLPVRAVLYTLSDSAPWLIAVQLLDGIGAGIFGAITPLIIADLMRGTGRFNLAQGAVATVQGIGASLSGLAAGIIVDDFGYAAAFLTSAAAACAALAALFLAMPETAPLLPGPGATIKPGE